MPSKARISMTATIIIRAKMITIYYNLAQAIGLKTIS